jgi:hypothetical protein
MTWEEVVHNVSARHPELTVGRMFGMPCLRRGDGKVVAALWKDGAIMVKFIDAKARADALAIPGVDVGRHAFDPTRRMTQWVHVPATRADQWEHLVEQALGDFL